MAKRGNGEGSIFKRHDGRWSASLTVGQSGGRRLRKSFYGKTRREAAAKLAEARHAQVRGMPVGDDRLTTGEFLQAWLRDSVAERVRPATFKSYAAKVNHHIAPALGRVPLGKLTPQDVERMLRDQQRAGLPARSVRHNLAVLRNGLNVAMRWGLVGRNVAALVDAPTVPARQVRAISPADGRCILAAVQGDRLEAVFTVGLALGLRQSEALGLSWSHVDLDAGSLRVERTLQRVGREYRFFETKSARSRRTIPLPAQVVDALRQHRVRQLEERLRAGTAWAGERWGELVFPDELGEPLSGFHVTRRLRALLRRAALQAIRYHDLRHGAASLMAAQGVPPRVAMEVLGHAQISTTMEIYSHVAPEFQRDAADRIAAALWATA